MSRIEVTPKELFKQPLVLWLFLNDLEEKELERLIGCSIITIYKKNLGDEDIDFNAPDKVVRELRNIWKRIEKDLLLSYNSCGK